jgi:3',5'-cyclic AMP phosphodiesterase CpdA
MTQVRVVPRRWRSSLTILHLSDIQFGCQERALGRLGAQPVGGGAMSDLPARLREDIARIEEHTRMSLWDPHRVARWLQLGRFRPDLVVVTGDLTETGDAAQFETARLFLEGLADALSLGRHRVLVVPGNHDIDLKQPGARRLHNWLDFVAAFYGEASSPRTIHHACSLEKPWCVVGLEDLRVAVACLNSTIGEDGLPQHEYGGLGQAQIDEIRSGLLEYGARRWLRLGIVHHNPVRAPVADNSNIRDVSALVSHLGGHLNLVLHGHRHLSHQDWIGDDSPLRVFGAGATAALDRAPLVPNQYQLILVSRYGTQYALRQYAPNHGRWLGDTSATKDGCDWISRPSPVPLRGVEKTFPRWPKRLAWAGLGIAAAILLAAALLRGILQPPTVDGLGVVVQASGKGGPRHEYASCSPEGDGSAWRVTVRPDWPVLMTFVRVTPSHPWVCATVSYTWSPGQVEVCGPKSGRLTFLLPEQGEIPDQGIFDVQVYSRAPFQHKVLSEGGPARALCLLKRGSRQ